MKITDSAVWRAGPNRPDDRDHWRTKNVKLAEKVFVQTVNFPDIALGNVGRAVARLSMRTKPVQLVEINFTLGQKDRSTVRKSVGYGSEWLIVRAKNAERCLHLGGKLPGSALPNALHTAKENGVIEPVLLVEKYSVRRKRINKNSAHGNAIKNTPELLSSLGADTFLSTLQTKQIISEARFLNIGSLCKNISADA